MDKATRKAITETAKALAGSKKLVAQLEADFAELRLEALRTVAMTKVDDTITLEAGNRIIKARKNVHGRYKVTEGHKTLISEYMGGNIHDLRFELAMGNI